jgi:hypothetical protein
MIEIVIPAIIFYFLFSGDKKKPENVVSPVAPNMNPPNPTDSSATNIPPPSNVLNPIEDRFDTMIKKYADAYGIPWQIIKAHLEVESNYGTSSQVMERRLGGGNKRGIMGITEIAFNYVKQMLRTNWTPDDLWKPEVSLECATALIRANTIILTKDKDFFLRDYSNISEAEKQKKSENFIRIVMAYNAGAGAVQSGTFKQGTKDYFNAWATAFQKINSRQI